MKTLRKTLAALLALALLLGLAACGAKEEPAGPAAEAPAGGSGQTRYTADFLKLHEGLRESVTPLLYTDEGFYARIYENMGAQLGEGVTEGYAGQYDSYQYSYWFVSYDGQLRRLEDYSPACVWENTEGYAGFESSSGLTGLFLNEAGELVALETGTASWYAGPEGLTQEDEEYWQYLQTETRCYVRRLDENGGELSRAEPELDDMLYINEGCVPDGKGDLLLSYISNEGESCVAALREDGSVAYRMSFDGYLQGLALLSGGRPAALGQLPSGWGLQLIDAEAKGFGESYTLPSDVMELIPGDDTFDFYYNGGSSLCGYRLETGEKEPILSWLDCDVNSSDLSGLTLRAGTVLAVENDWSGDETSSYLVTLNPGAADAAAEKRVLTLAAVDLDYNAQNAVIAFNRQSPDTRIQVTDYSQYNADGDESAGLTKLTTEILSGKLPDILALSGLPYDQLAAKGLLEDLYPWLDGDGELSREDFFPSVLNAMETGGGLYQVCPYFSVSTAIGARDLVGDRQGWTYEDLYAALAALPEGSTIFSASMTKTEALRRCLEVNMDSLVDWAAGSCRFDSEDFLALLDFADRFPAEAPVEAGGGAQLLRSVTVNEFRSMAFDELYFGGEGSTVYIGYPSFDGSCGSAIDLDEGFAMSAACADKEAAWAFLRVFMTADYQSNQYKLPSNRARFEKNLAVAMTPTYQLDEQGNYVLDADGNRIQQPIVYMDGVPLYCTTQAQAGRLRTLVENCTKAVRPAADTLFDIILEDAQAYFSGQKSAEEAAKLIQSKVSLYMGEQG